MIGDATQARVDRFRTAKGDLKLVRFMIREYPETKSEWLKLLYEEVSDALRTVENTAAHTSTMAENALRDEVLRYLKGIGYPVIGERDLRGHTDLSIEQPDIGLTWLGECKIFTSSYEHLRKGMRQLMERYSSGVNQALAMIVFVGAPDARSVHDKWKDEMEDSDEFTRNLGPTEHATLPLCFETGHKHTASGLNVIVHHLAAALHYKPTDTKKKAAEKSGAKIVK